MKVVILAGGYGTRISEESHLRPKPMIEIGSIPILVHIMKIYSQQGFNEFIICGGYKCYFIKEYFFNYLYYNSDITINLKSENEITIHMAPVEQWNITVIDTGLDTMTGGRIKRIQPYINNGDTFMATYGDGVSDININKLLAFHKAGGKTATLTGIRPGNRFGGIELGENNIIKSFKEKHRNDGPLINGGFFVLNYNIFDYLSGDATVFEQEPLETLAKESELLMYYHDGFWSPMDTLKDKQYLEDLWKNDQAPWKNIKDIV